MGTPPHRTPPGTAEHGPQGDPPPGPQASMDDIAAHGNTSKPVYYRYFGDKEGCARP
ncbi:TetR family transcriptional regulator [Arthrobacter sp. JCM 19049]|uniref:TetR/AcrR family transcriptional regulator n=1 Tax=Arthrobacter sp. JCM 19049 TaxID=1460643 RepID=UPI00243712A0|nr:TetR family transcriptional regulator [Arthrobacter sp. JCM 19049]